ERWGDGRTTAVEVNPREATVEWTVSLANRKGVGRRLKQPGCYRNDVDPDDGQGAKPFIIQTEPVSVARRPGHDPHRAIGGGKFLTHRGIKLGDALVDDDGRLLVLGGHGVSRYVRDHGENEDRPIKAFADNDRWFDDTSDGLVCARIVLKDASKMPVGE